MPDTGITRQKAAGLLVSEAEYQAAQTETFLEKIYEGDAKELISTRIQKDLISADDYEDLKSIGKAVTRGDERAVKNNPVTFPFRGAVDSCFAPMQTSGKRQVK